MAELIGPPGISPRTALAIRAAVDTAAAHGIRADRCDVLQNGNTLVLRLAEDLVARVVQDTDGPRQGTAWFARENAIAQHLTLAGAPVIPLHPDIPPGPHERGGFPLNFWVYVSATGADPDPAAAGAALLRCHRALRDFRQLLPELAILTEAVSLLTHLGERQLFPPETIGLLQRHLDRALAELRDVPRQPLHGDAHPGNIMTTTRGLLWTDWEDAFSGPVEWDLASVIWNARFLEHDHAFADAMLQAYTDSGGSVSQAILDRCLTARAAVMSAWYPVLYPEPDASRREKLAQRLAWLRAREE